MTTGKLAAALGVLLFLSLAGNMFLAGYVIGQKTGDTAPEQTASDNDRRENWKKRDDALRQKLSPEDLKIFEQARANNRPRIETLKAELEKARTNVLAAQTAEPFDQQALDAAVEEEVEKKTVFLQAIREMRKDILKQLSPEGRKEMRKLHARDGHKNKDGRRGDDRHGDRREIMRERIRERIQNGEDPMRREDSAPPVPPPHEPPPRDYGEHPPAPSPQDGDCGGCEGPSGDNPLFLEP